MFRAGLQKHEFEEMVRELERIRSKRSSACMNYTAAILCWVPLLYVMPCVFCCFDSRHKRQILDMDRELKSWQDTWNRSRLSARGLHLKTQSRCILKASHSHGSVTFTPKYEWWIVIALCPDESEKLKKEPHLYGVINNRNSCLCSAIDETELCSHAGSMLPTLDG
eukprot:761036-Hanusia_phi.AAC.2